MAIRSSALLLVGGLLPLLLSAPSQAFEIFCVEGGDGTLSCQRLDDGQAAILCVDSPSGVRSCTSPDGVESTCVRSRGNVYSCATADGGAPDTTRCQLTAAGTWACDPPAARPDPLLPPPPGVMSDPTASPQGLDPLESLESGGLPDLTAPAVQAPASPQQPLPDDQPDDAIETPGFDSSDIVF